MTSPKAYICTSDPNGSNSTCAGPLMPSMELLSGRSALSVCATLLLWEQPAVGSFSSDDREELIYMTLESLLCLLHWSLLKNKRLCRRLSSRGLSKHRCLFTPVARCVTWVFGWSHMWVIRVTRQPWTCGRSSYWKVSTVATLPALSGLIICETALTWMVENPCGQTSLDGPLTSFTRRPYVTDLPPQQWLTAGTHHQVAFLGRVADYSSLVWMLLFFFKSPMRPGWVISKLGPWWCQRHTDITPVIRGKKSPGGCRRNNDAWHHSWTSSLKWRVPPDFSICEQVWHPLGARTVKRAEIMAFTINTADVPYFRWTNSSQLTVLVSALYLSD